MPAKFKRSAAKTFLLRLPLEYQRKLKDLKSKTGVPMGQAARRAIDAALAAHGIEPTVNEKG